MTDKIADELRAEGELLALQPELGEAFRRGTRIFAAADALDAKDKQIAELAGGWQPIETAPTNRAVLIRLPGLDYYGNDGVYAGMLVDMGTGKRWITFGWAIGRDVGSDWPDVWQPLPAPPSRSLPAGGANG